MEYWYKISVWPSFWCGSLTKRWALWIHLVEAVPDLFQIVQKDKTMGVNSLQSPTIGLLDVHKYGQRLFKFPETASQRSRDSVWYFLNLFPSGFDASQQPFGANYQILVPTENKPTTEPICSIYFPGTQGGKKAQRKSNRWRWHISLGGWLNWYSSRLWVRHWVWEAEVTLWSVWFTACVVNYSHRATRPCKCSSVIPHLQALGAFIAAPRLARALGPNRCVMA